jgi:DHA2 family multidrug resistance protein
VAWVITSYIVASAIMIPTAGWLSTRFGRKRVFLYAVSAFTAASVLCGAADSLTMEVLARIAQGMGGAFLIPLSHAIILDTYPPEEHGKAMALWGTGSVFGSVIGPTVGGYVTEYLSWRFIFYLNVPLGLIALLGAAVFVPETQRDPRRRLDWFGFLTLAVGIGALQMMLDRGQRLDWFESGEIVIEACLAALGLYLFAVHTLTARQPFLDPRLIAQRHYFLSLMLISFYGLLSVPPMVMMPSFWKICADTPSTPWLLMPRGVGMLGRDRQRSHHRKVDPAAHRRRHGGADHRQLELRGTAEVGEWPIVWTGLVQGAGAGIMLVPVQVIAFPSLPPAQRTEGAAVFNTVRSVCSSVGVSVTLTMFVVSSAATHSRLVEYISPIEMRSARTDSMRARWRGLPSSSTRSDCRRRWRGTTPLTSSWPWRPWRCCRCCCSLAARPPRRRPIGGTRSSWSSAPALRATG